MVMPGRGQASQLKVNVSIVLKKLKKISLKTRPTPIALLDFSSWLPPFSLIVGSEGPVIDR